MADPTQVEILKSGVRAWNEWRKQNPQVRPDLAGADFGGANLDKVNLCGAELGAAVLTEAKLRWADLSDALMSRAHLDRADLTEANINGAKLRYVSLNKANLSQAKLRRSDLMEGNLRAADLTWADLSRADLSQADLSEADLSRADLMTAVLQQTKLTHADVSECVMGSTIFVDVDLSEIKGLETVKHSSPSSIGIDTVYRSKGNIPEIFLRGAGVPENFIEYMHSIVGTAFEFYSCFISYSGHDQDFAERLYADLQAKGVRCWFAPHDMKPGQKLHEQIDAAIRIHDKLILILSRESAKSSWVKQEVEKALMIERETHRTVLFPINLDNSIFEISVPWAEALRERFILNFSDWTHERGYRLSLSRLAKALTLIAATEVQESA